MSHIVRIQTEVRDPQALRQAAQRLQLPEPTYGLARLFSSSVIGWRVQLNQWRYPVVCDTQTGQLHFDNYGGRWGKQNRLDALLQSYAIEKSKIEARKQGHSVLEQPLADGSVKLTIQVGGAS